MRSYDQSGSQQRTNGETNRRRRRTLETRSHRLAADGSNDVIRGFVKAFSLAAARFTPYDKVLTKDLPAKVSAFINQSHSLSSCLPQNGGHRSYVNGTFDNRTICRTTQRFLGLYMFPPSSENC